MGIKFARDYETIINELIPAILKIQKFYEFFEMSEDDWSMMSDEEKTECARTLADDLFYGLGNEPLYYISEGKIEYDDINRVIKVHVNTECIDIISVV